MVVQAVPARVEDTGTAPAVTGGNDQLIGRGGNGGDVGAPGTFVVGPPGVGGSGGKLFGHDGQNGS